MKLYGHYSGLDERVFVFGEHLRSGRLPHFDDKVGAGRARKNRTHSKNSQESRTASRRVERSANHERRFHQAPRVRPLRKSVVTASGWSRAQAPLEQEVSAVYYAVEDGREESCAIVQLRLRLTATKQQPYGNQSTAQDHFIRANQPREGGVVSAFASGNLRHTHSHHPQRDGGHYARTTESGA